MITDAQLNEVAHFKPDISNAMRPALGGGVDAVSAAGALDLTKLVTELSVDGTKAYTLAAPTVAGQRKIVRCVAGTNTPAGTLTVSSPDTTTGFVCPTTFFFDTAGQLLEFQATTGLKWRCVRKIRAGVKTLVLGTTVTTGICDMSHVNVTVDGTKASTTADKALPNGAAVGELVSISCSAAINTPHGDLGATIIKKDGIAGTQVDDFTLATDFVMLQWNGAAWQAAMIATAGTTLTIV